MVERCSAQRDALVDGDIVADFGGLADDHAHAVIDEKTPADSRAGMDFDSGQQARELRQRAGQKEPAVLPQPVIDAIPPQRVQAGVEQHDLQPRSRRGIALQHRGDVFAHETKIGSHGSYTVTGSASCAIDFIAHLLEEHAAQVALAERRQHHHDQLAGILRTRTHAHRRHHRRSRRDAHQQSFFHRQPARHHQRIVARHLHDFVDVVGAQNAGNESGADALNLVRRRRAAGKHRTLHRLHRNRLERWPCAA